MNPSQLEILQKLELIPKPEEPPKKKHGRPKGSKNKAKTASTPAADTPKRKRGRPLGSKNKPIVSSSEVEE